MSLTVTHKAVKSPNDILYASEWNDDHDVSGSVGGGASIYNAFKISCAYNSIIQGTWSFTQRADQFLDGFWQNTTFEQGDGLRYKFGGKSGSYNFKLLSTMDDNLGIATIYVDEVSQGTINTYNAATTWNVIYTLAITVLTDGDHTLDIVCTGKSGSLYLLKITAWWITD